MAPHSSTLAWKISWKEEPGRLQSMGSWRVRHDWATSLSLFTFMHWRRKWQPIPVFLAGESQGQGSLVGCHLWGCRVGHDWSDLAAMLLLNHFSHVWLCVTLWTVAYQAPLSMGFLQAKTLKWIAMPSSGDLPNPGIAPESLTSVFCIGRRVLYH